MKRSLFVYDGTTARRKNRILSLTIIVFVFLTIAALLGFGINRLTNYVRVQRNLSSDRLYALWSEQNYEEVYELSKQIAVETPFQNTAATLRGYSSYYLALSQTDNSLAQNYLDDSIASLRLAKIYARDNVQGQVSYMLAKAYFLKNSLNSYSYFSDLVVKYLLEAKEYSYEADDISEYLGLAYASLNMIPESIESFTNALMVRESDVLLFSIGEQYYKSANYSVAKPYFFRVMSTSSDDSLVLKSKNLLALTYIEEENYSEAEKEFTAILEKDVNYADAYYGLGVLYEKQGDLVKARAYWRSALKAQAGHLGATEKLSA